MVKNYLGRPAARDDLHRVIVSVAQNNLNRSMSLEYELISEADRLQERLLSL